MLQSLIAEESRLVAALNQAHDAIHVAIRIGTELTHAQAKFVWGRITDIERHLSDVRGKLRLARASEPARDDWQNLLEEFAFDLDAAFEPSATPASAQLTIG